MFYDLVERLATSEVTMQVRKSRWLALCLSLLVVGVACGTNGPDPSLGQYDANDLLAAPENLGFEEPGPRGGAQAWYRIGYEGRTGDDVPEVKIDPTLSRTGRHSGFVAQQAPPNGIALPAGWQQGYSSHVFAGRTIRVSGWIRTEGVGTCKKCDTQGLTQASAIEAGELGAWLGLGAHPRHDAGAADAEPVQAIWLTPHVTGTSDWTLFEATVTLPPNSEEAYLRAVLWGPGKAWFDDIQIVTQ